MLDILKAAILGIIEGITEFLPISSTGHLYLADEFVKLNESTAFINMFMVVIQLGAIMAVVVLYFTKLNPWAPSKSVLERRQTWTLWAKVIIAVLPSVIVGLPLNDWMEDHLTSWQVIAATLIIYGLLFIVIENYNRTKRPRFTDLNQLPIKLAVFIGIFQILSMVPGTSRSGATILGAILIGTSRFVATEFSFFLAIPTMFGASLLKVLKYFLHGNTFTGSQIIVLLTGVIVSFAVAYLAIKFLLHYIRNNDFKLFGWYRIVLGAVVITYFGLLH
ncbi:undecaprenyl-diphosphate phosphatase [Levilactobacillus parabrevis]|uniref:Undecaprenyl-diphosphatase n=1 Tax=Levilactobacillus parabrevis ATCC 53295 TaxID=1267003 RepID=A0A0R1GL97_9LACO|nr:undecaprenyl-diphosphate phosphatase [Levilactobacillus parabrevis]KRK33235.1 undecaprenyl pyrophosphate phosphatase [Levilactobacillus parabrevis ATCC 53295]KRO04222.1 undecaprenyl pyrophosphate phosphatase [Levilactobacillus parabrevis]MCT4486497.1 undecaprenyl-diphosphate phosphatase [Levilactobacillus parabrevis]MCT4489878.1 undecaprenyl-diphosphate phosphatase [Levilactobacillus parabrevis]